MCVEFLFFSDSFSQLVSNFQNVKSLWVHNSIYLFILILKCIFYCAILSCSICHLVRRKYAAQKKKKKEKTAGVYG